MEERLDDSNDCDSRLARNKIKAITDRYIEQASEGIPHRSLFIIQT